MFVNVISMVTAIFWCTSYDMILGFTPSWEDCHSYFLHMVFIANVSILIYMHSQKCIKFSLFELVVTCIGTRIFVPSLSISHIFISILKFFMLFITLG